MEGRRQAAELGRGASQRDRVAQSFRNSCLRLSTNYAAQVEENIVKTYENIVYRVEVPIKFQGAAHEAHSQRLDERLSVMQAQAKKSEHMTSQLEKRFGFLEAAMKVQTNTHETRLERIEECLFGMHAQAKHSWSSASGSSRRPCVSDLRARGALAARRRAFDWRACAGEEAGSHGVLRVVGWLRLP